MKLSDILCTREQVLKNRWTIDNDMIKGADIAVVGHFGNAVSLNVWTTCCCLFHNHDNTQNLGILIKALVELFDLTDEDGYSFSKIKDIPCRIISGGFGTKVIGFGHFMKDKFVYTDDLQKLTE